jgi:tRNA(Ile)-lysidine synthase
MLEVITSYIEQHHLLPEEGMVIVAVSGGADSLCLLHLLYRLCGSGKRYPGVRLYVAHLDHQLRGEASAHDAATVAALARSWHLPVTIGQADVLALARQERRGIEEMARIARYHFLRALAQEVEATSIAIAHHMDDQVETLLLHWLRGGGLASMVGLQPRQQELIRPLLCVSRADTQAYCAEHGLVPLDDASNNDTRFLRNRIRHQLLPLLTEMNPGYRHTLLRNAEAMQVDLAWIETQVDIHWPQVVGHVDGECIHMSLPRLLALPLSLQRHLLRRASALLSAGQSPLEVRHYQLIEQLLQRERTSAALTLHLPQRLHLTRLMDSLVLERVPADSSSVSPLEESAEALLPVPGCVMVPGTSWLACADLLADDLFAQVYPALRRAEWTTVWHLLPTDQHQVYIDADRLGHDTISEAQMQLCVRTRRHGDRMQPLGMAHEKKIQDILVDKHIPRAQRSQIPLFFSGGHCIWLAGVQVDDRVRLTPDTQRILRLAIISASA